MYIWLQNYIKRIFIVLNDDVIIFGYSELILFVSILIVGNIKSGAILANDFRGTKNKKKDVKQLSVKQTPYYSTKVNSVWSALIKDLMS